MSETKELLRRGAEGFAPRKGVMDSLVRRRARKDRTRKITAAVVGIILAIVIFASLIQTLKTAGRPADQPAPSPVREDSIFADVHGWIVYSRPSAHSGIWAVNPTGRGRPEEPIQVAEDGQPLAWSQDGSKLLIVRWGRDNGRRWNGLFVLNADGTEARIAFEPMFGSGSATAHYLVGASLSPDGSRVVYADLRYTERGDVSSKIYTVDSDGGTPRFLHASQRVSPELYDPVFSPDGQRIAYIAGWGDHDNGVWIMNADGSNARELAVPAEIENPQRIIGWSNDGSRIFFDGCCESGVWVVGADGSGLAPLFHKRVGNPYLSPDGSRIAYQPIDPVSGSMVRALEIADLDGTHVQRFGYGGSGPWNPLPLAPGASGTSAAAGDRTGAVPVVYAMVAVAVGAVLVLALRRRARRVPSQSAK